MIAATSPTADLLRLAVHAGTNVAALVDACLSLLPADHSAVIARPVLQQRHDVTSAALLHFGEEDGPAVQAAFGPATPARDLARKVVGTKRARAASTEDPDVRLCAITISSFILKRAAILFCDSLCAGSQECGPAHFLLWCTFCRQLKKHGQTQLMNSLLATYENQMNCCTMIVLHSLHAHQTAPLLWPPAHTCTIAVCSCLHCINSYTSIIFSLRAGLLEPVEGLSKTGDSVPCIIPLNRATVVIGRGPQLPDHGIPLLSSIAFEQRSKTVVSRSVNASWLAFKFGAHAGACRPCFKSSLKR